MWEALSVGLKMLALIVMFTFIGLAFGAGIVKMQNKKRRERLEREARGE
ncbi:MAG: hypothetical protein KKE73_06105 [Proteobacteria bacterium]|nr:hypothetical protein [Pseudomonadota bacterium]